MPHLLNLTGRLLIALLFLGGAIQKLTDPAPVTAMIASLGLPGWLTWPVAAFDLAAEGPGRFAIRGRRGPFGKLWVGACPDSPPKAG
ncbi:MAG: DoxX family membrane protein [Paracoccaceae bacterium]